MDTQDHAGAGAADPDLVGLVQLADAYGLESRLVLTLAGQVVDGTLVAERTWAAEVAAVIQAGDPDDTLRGAMAATFRQRAEDLQGWGAGSKLGDLDPESPDGPQVEKGEEMPSLPDVTYVHLRYARVSSVPGERLPLWRGRLADVTGWTAGGFED